MLKIAFLGHVNKHYTTLAEALASTDATLAPLASSSCWDTTENHDTTFRKAKTKVARIWSQFSGTGDIEFLKRMDTCFSKYEPQVILAYWGSNVIPDIITVKKKYPKSCILLNVMCHPMGLSPGIVNLQNWHMRIAARYIDGFIFSSRTMKDYFERMIMKGTPLPHAIIPPVFSRKDFPTEYREACVNTPNILYMGRHDWSQGQASDNVGKQLDDLIDAGVHVYYAGNVDDHVSVNNRHVFTAMRFEQLRSYATQFDASLILYNLEACSSTDRFAVTIPDRLIGSVTFGLPIAIPKKGYDACKEFLEKYEAVIEFDSFDDLKNQLGNRARMQSLKKCARRNSAAYALENHVNHLLDFAGTVLRHRSRKACPIGTPRKKRASLV